MATGLDRNPITPARQLRNWQKLADGLGTSLISVGAPLNNDGTQITLVLADNGGLVDSGGLGIELDGSTLALGANGLSIANDGVGADQLGILTTKGDILTYATAPTRLAVGADGLVLAANSATSTGLSWVTPYTSPLTTTGDLLYLDETHQRLAVGAAGQVLASTGTVPAWANRPRLLFANTADSDTVANTATETTFGSAIQFTVPANTLTAGKIFRIALGFRGQATGTPTCTIAVKLGSVTILSRTNANVQSGIRGWTIQAIGRVQADGESGQTATTGFFALGDLEYSYVGRSIGVALDTTVDQTLDITATWSAADPNNNVKIEVFSFELLN